MKNEFDGHWSLADYDYPSPTKLMLAKEFLAPVLKEINETSNILRIIDAGCGDGIHAMALSNLTNKKFEYIGIDISKIAIEKSCKRLFEDNRFKFMVCDLEDVRANFASKPVDIIFSYGVIAYTRNPKDTIRSLTSILKKGGLFHSWTFTPTRFQKISLLFIRLISKIIGKSGTDKLAELIVYFMKCLPISSGVNLSNSSFNQCKETVLINIAPKKLWLPSADTVKKWHIENGLTAVFENSKTTQPAYYKK